MDKLIKDVTCDVIIPVFNRDKYVVFKSLYSYNEEKHLIQTFILSYDNYRILENFFFELLVLFFKVVLQYKIVVLRTRKKIYAAKARQRASMKSTSEVIFYQDADDISHPNRVSSIKRIFGANTDCLHLLHGYVYKKQKFEKTASDTIHLKELLKIYSKDDLLVKPHRFGKEIGLRLALGVPVIRRIVLEKVKWKSYNERELLKHLGERGEDHEFNMDCLFQFNKSYAFLSKPYRYMKDNG